MLNSKQRIAILILLLSAALSVFAQNKSAQDNKDKPIVQTQDALSFAGLPVLPSCLTFGVDRGDPTSGASVILIKAKAGCVVPWHWHTFDEELMLVSGDGKIEMTNVPAHQLSAGSYVLLPATHQHQFTCSTDCVLFDAIAGKFDIHYVDKSGKEIPVDQALKAVNETPAETPKK